MVSCGLCYRKLNIFNPQDTSQRRVHYFVCCIKCDGNPRPKGCGHSALICNSCRKYRWSSSSPDKICHMCGNTGYCFSCASIGSKMIEDLIFETKRWNQALILFSNIRLPKVQHTLSCLGYFNVFFKKHHFWTISYADWIRRFFPVERHNLALFQKIFFQNVIQSCISTVNRRSFSYKWIAITRGIFLLAKNITFSKLLICRLFGESRTTSFLTTRIDFIKSIQQLMSMVLHRVLSNFHYLSQL